MKEVISEYGHALLGVVGTVLFITFFFGTVVLLLSKVFGGFVEMVL